MSTNGTCAPAANAINITQYANVVFAAVTMIASGILLLLKKDGLFDRFMPRPLPRKQTLRKLHEVDNRLGDIIIQLTNLTPQHSSQDSNSNDGRIRSSAGFRSDRNSDSDEDVQRLRVCEEGRCIEIQHAPATILEEPRGLGGGAGTRAEPRRWSRQIELVHTADTRRDQAAGRSSSRSGSAPRHDQSSKRQTLRSSVAPERVAPDQ